MSALHLSVLTADAIERLGNKSAGKKYDDSRQVFRLFREVKKHCMNGRGGCNNCCRSIGYPVIVKAALGGGGKGMRVAADADRASDMHFSTAQKEAVAAFGDDTMYTGTFCTATQTY